MTRSRGKPKYIGSCGIYVFATGHFGGSSRLLVHRRSKQLSEPRTIASPGGIVERRLCQPSGACDGQLNFDLGARTTAVQELLEETGIELGEDALERMEELPVGDGAYWGPQMHRNYCVRFADFPAVRGPEKSSLHEIERGGMDGIGAAAGDGFHAWVEVHELLRRPDLMKGCRVPIAYFAAEASSAGPRAPQESTEEHSRPAKRPRGSVGQCFA